MVKLEEDFDDELEDFEDFKEDKPLPQSNYDYKSRRILVWVAEKEIRQMVEDTLGFLLPLATIRIADSEEHVFKLSEKEEWDTFVVDFMEEGVSTSEFVKMINNEQNLLVALNYSQLNREDEQFATSAEPIRKLFDLDAFNNQTEEQE